MLRNGCGFPAIGHDPAGVVAERFTFSTQSLDIRKSAGYAGGKDGKKHMRNPCVECGSDKQVLRSKHDDFGSVLACCGCGSAVALAPHLARGVTMDWRIEALVSRWNARNPPPAPELKPCPFCGHAAEIFPDNDGFATVACRNSDCHGGMQSEYIGTAKVEGDLRAELVTRWNRRHE
jgi:hypothetical protein